MIRFKRSRPKRVGEPDAVYVVVGENLAATLLSLPASADKSSRVYGPPYESWISPEYLAGVSNYAPDVLKEASSALRSPDSEPRRQVAVYARYENTLVLALLDPEDPVVQVQNERNLRVTVAPEIAARFAGVVRENFHPSHRRLLPLRAALGFELPDLVPATQTAERLANAPLAMESTEDILANLDHRAREHLEGRLEAIRSSPPARVMAEFTKTKTDPGFLFGTTYLLTSLIPRLAQRGVEQLAGDAIRRSAAASRRSSGGSGTFPKNRPGRS